MSPAFEQEEAPTRSPEAQEAFDTALDAHDSGDMTAAAASYRRAVVADPNMTVAHNNLGMVLIQQELLSEAVAALQQAVKVAPDYAEAYNNLGFAYRRMSRDLEAAEHYEKFLALTPDVEDASRIREWIAKARAEAAPPAGEVSAVEEVVPPAGEEAPTLPEAPPAGPAVSPEAPPVAAEAPAPPEGSPPAEAGEGFSDFFKSDLSSLTASPGAGAESPPAPAEAVPETPPAAAAPAGDESGLSDKAQAEFDEMFGGDGPADGEGAAPEAAPEDPKVGQFYTEAMTKFQDGDMGEAARFCSLALENAPKHFPTLLLAGRVALGRQDFSRAGTLLQKAAEARGDDPEVYYFLGQCYEKRGLLDEAQGVYKKCLEVSPEGPRAKRLAAWLEKRSDEGQVAVGMARCELCLRAVKEEETTVHQGRKVCGRCLETLGPEESAARPRDDEDKRAEKRSIKRSGVPGGKVLVVLLLLILFGGGYLALGYFDYAPLPAQLAELLGKKPKKPKKPIIRRTVVINNGTGPNNGKPPNGQKPPPKKKVEPQEMSFGAVTEPVLLPLERLELVLPLKLIWPGEKTETPENAEPLRFELLTKPDGMLLDEASGRLTWTPGKDGDLKVPSEHEVVLKVTCGKKSAKGKTRIKVKYPLGTAREQDMRLPGAYRASVLGLAFADFDGDGQPDLAASCGGPLSGRLSVLPTGSPIRGGGGMPSNWPLPGAPVGTAAADLDGDGRVDLAWVEWMSGRLQILRGSMGRIAAKPVRAGRVPGPVESLALVDLDGDRRAEFVTASRRNGKLFVHRAKGAQLASAKLPPGGVPVVLFALGAAPGRRGQRLGLVASGGRKTGKLYVYSLRKGKLVADQQLDIPTGLVLAARSGDFNADGKPDVALLFGGRTGAITVLNGAEEGKLARQARPLATGSLPQGMDVGDINGDGKTDIIVAGPGGLSIYLSAGRGRFLHAGSSRLLGLAGPVALWSSRKGRPARAAALSLKGRAWVLKLPAPPKRRPPAPPPPKTEEKKKAGKKKEAGS